MENETFKDTLKNSNVSLRGVSEYLGLNGIDIDDTDVDGTIEYSLIPDYRRYGLDGIEVKLQRIIADVTWSVNDDELTSDEIAKCIAAGGIAYRNGSIEGQFKLYIIAEDDLWEIDTKNCGFKPSGAISIDEVEFELGGTGKKQVTIS